MVIGAALAAAAYAYASYAPGRALLVVAMLGGLGQATSLLVDLAELGATFASASNSANPCIHITSPPFHASGIST